MSVCLRFAFFVDEFFKRDVVIDRIKKLAEESQKLEPTARQKAQWDEKMIAYSNRFLNAHQKIPVYQPSNEEVSRLDQCPFADEARPMHQLLEALWHAVDQNGINPAGPSHMGYVPGGGVVPTAIGDYLAAITNRYAGITYANPGAVHMENLCLAWMAEMVGYPKESVGNLASGGSIATLTAIVSARDHHGITPENIRKQVVYATRQAHHCILKAFRIAGLDHCVFRDVPMIENYKMDIEALSRLLSEDLASGLTPFMIIGSAGSTDVGVIDPLDQMADLAQAYDCWFHIDAAYGGFFALLEEMKVPLRGIERSDSIVIDPHKGLFLSYGTGAVLIKNVAAVHRSHHYFANYMQDAFDQNNLRNPADLSPELTKHFRGLRMWMSLQLLGVAPFRAALREKLLLTQYFYQKVQELGFEVGQKPELSVCIFRWKPKNGDSNQFNRDLVGHIQSSGKIFLSSTTIDGVFWPRICIMVFRTHLKEVNNLLDILAEFVAPTK